MLIQCTKALLRELALEPDGIKEPHGYEDMPQALMAWHAGIVELGSDKAVVLMNNATRYPIVLYGAEPLDSGRIKHLIRDAVTETLSAEGISSTIIGKYMADAGEIEFSRTAGRTLVTRLNNTVDNICFHDGYLDERAVIQRYLSIVGGRVIQTIVTGHMDFPIKVLMRYLGERYGETESGVRLPVIDVKAYQLKIQLEMEGFHVWRRVVVPSTFSFRHLHNVIQIVFDWHNTHLHMFMTGQEGLSPRELIVMEDGPDSFGWARSADIIVLPERLTSLKDVLSRHGEVVYQYDFGDMWIHRITVEGTVRSNTFVAVYVDGKGDRPPEDVGGQSGYAEFSRIMASERHPRHEALKAWAESQSPRQLIPEQINKTLPDSVSVPGDYSPRWIWGTGAPS